MILTHEERFSEFVHHLMKCRTIEFRYRDVPYVIGDCEDTTYIEDCGRGVKTYFGKRFGSLDDRISGRKQLLYAKIFDQKTFAEVFDEIKILSVTEG